MFDGVKILCLETSSLVCSVSVASATESFHVKSGVIQNHAEVLMDLISECLQKANIQVKDLSAIAISDGPGSYTGLRIGSSTAKGLCFSSGIPLIGISTLKALAKRAFEMTDRTLVWPMIDARRMEVYHAIYNRALETVTTITNGIIDTEGFVPKGIDVHEVIICGDGGKKAADYLQLDCIDIQPDASYLCELALEAYRRQEFQELSNYEPFYLKSANITGKSK